MDISEGIKGIEIEGIGFFESQEEIKLNLKKEKVVGGIFLSKIKKHIINKDVFKILNNQNIEKENIIIRMFGGYKIEFVKKNNDFVLYSFDSNGKKLDKKIIFVKNKKKNLEEDEELLFELFPDEPILEKITKMGGLDFDIDEQYIAVELKNYKKENRRIKKEIEGLKLISIPIGIFSSKTLHGSGVTLEKNRTEKKFLLEQGSKYDIAVDKAVEGGYEITLLDINKKERIYDDINLVFEFSYKGNTEKTVVYFKNGIAKMEILEGGDIIFNNVEVSEDEFILFKILDNHM